MIRAAALALSLILAASAARAQSSFQSCIDQTQGWSKPYSGGLITAINYIVSMPIGPAPPRVPIRLHPNQTTMGWLIGINGPVDNPAYIPPPGPARNVNILVSVAANVAAQYQKLTSADAKFAQQRRSSHELLLLDGTFCPLLAEDAAFSATGYPIWSR